MNATEEWLRYIETRALRQRYGVNGVDDAEKECDDNTDDAEKNADAQVNK